MTADSRISQWLAAEVLPAINLSALIHTWESRTLRSESLHSEKDLPGLLIVLENEIVQSVLRTCRLRLLKFSQLQIEHIWSKIASDLNM